MTEQAAAASSYAVVVPTVGRPTLREALQRLVVAEGPPPVEIVVVDDRRAPAALLDPGVPVSGTGRPGAPVVRVVSGGGRGPAAARNAGWRSCRAPWVVFLDDDVLPALDWPACLAADLAGLPADVGGTQGRVRVPLPPGRRPNDAERNTAHLAHSAWITADMAYRRPALASVGGFDERFRRAYREDADLALRMMDAGYRLVRGSRRVDHPVRPADWWASVRAQAGNADDALMRRRHGRRWRERAGERPGRFRGHLVTAAAGSLAVVLAAARRPRLAGPAAATWAGLTAEFAASRIAPGPRTPDEVVRMLVTSAVIPPAACWHRLRGEIAHRRAGRAVPAREAGAPARQRAGRPAAVLFDRDGTLVHDVAYNGDPARVRPVPGARRAVEQVRAHGLPVAVVSNQSGLARGRFRPEDLARVNARIEELLGPFDAWAICPHDDGDGCGCRKPAPGLIHQAASQLRVRPEECVVIGDTGGDVEAALAAGARAILVPTPRTRREEVQRAPEVARDLGDAVARALDGSLSGSLDRSLGGSLGGSLRGPAAQLRESGDSR